MSTFAKRKKLPACDYCKARRVLCHPQLNGSCPRCLEKGVDCTTTPVIRRKRRTKAELASTETSSSLSVSVEIPLVPIGHELVVPTPSAPFIGTSSEPSPVPPSLQLPSAVVEELIEFFRVSPRMIHPLISLSKMEAIRLGSTNLTPLQPQDRVIRHCILALSSLLSLNHFIIGPGSVSPEQSDIFTADSPLKIPIVPDLRDFGFRREPVFLQLWAEALWLANQEGIATNPSIVNAASCWILGYIAQIILGRCASPFNLAFVCHVRCLAEEGKLENINLVKYHGIMIGDVLSALMSGKSIQYTPNDELLIIHCASWEPLEKLLLRDSTTDFSTSIEVTLKFIHAFAHHIIRLARETSDNLTGVFARSQPLDECFLVKHFASLDLFHSFLLAVLDQITQFLRHYQGIHPLDRERLRACLHGFVTAWGCLVLPIFETLRDRSLQVAFNYTTIGSSSSPADDRNYERLQMHFRHARRLAATTAVEVGQALREVPSIAGMNHGGLVKWAKFLMDEDNVMDITHGERLQALQCFRDALQIIGFYRADRTGIVESVNEHLTSHFVQDVLATSDHPNTCFGAVSSYSSFTW